MLASVSSPVIYTVACVPLRGALASLLQTSRTSSMSSAIPGWPSGGFYAIFVFTLFSSTMFDAMCSIAAPFQASFMTTLFRFKMWFTQLSVMHSDSIAPLVFTKSTFTINWHFRIVAHFRFKTFFTWIGFTWFAQKKIQSIVFLEFNNICFLWIKWRIILLIRGIFHVLLLWRLYSRIKLSWSVLTCSVTIQMKIIQNKQLSFNSKFKFILC